jgi:type IV pilus assembly protein PilB
MRIPDSLAEDLLRSSGKFSKAEIAELNKQALKDKRPLQDVIVGNELISEKALTQLYAESIGIPFVDLNEPSIGHQELRAIPERLARRYNAVIFATDPEGNKLMAMENPDDMEAIAFLKKLLGDNVKVSLTTRKGLHSALDQYAVPVNNLSKPRNYSRYSPLDYQAIDDTISLIIDKAINIGASDIHIEPREEVAVIRYRVDGLLNEEAKLPINAYRAITSKLKGLSNISLEDHLSLHEGHFSVEHEAKTYKVITSTLPTINGEKVVLHLTSKDQKAWTFSDLGLWGSALKELQHSLVQPHGLILVCGPTGTGKSNTLYSMVSIINDSSLNISSIEDPVEFHVPGVNQVQINSTSGISFASTLKAVLRQVVGDINDTETAKLVVKVASSGTMVMASFHADDASSAIYKLVSLSGEPHISSTALRLVVSQRLARKLCIDCRIGIKPDAKTLTQLEKLFDFTAFGGYKELHALETQAFKEGLGKDIDKLSTTTKSIIKLWKARPEGCDNCNHRGYKGRIGVFEIINPLGNVQSLIASGASGEKIEKASFSNGNPNLRLDGLVKSLRGITTVGEVLRATS